MKHRLFIGLPVDEEGRRGLRKLVKKLKRHYWQVKWEEEEKWHMTLAFMGRPSDPSTVLNHAGSRRAQDDTTDLKSISVVSSMMVTTCKGVGPIELRFKGLETFPRIQAEVEHRERIRGRNMRRLTVRARPTVVLPKVIWVRMGGEVKQVTALAKDLRARLTKQGIWFDPKPFVPHITLGRVNKNSSREERIEISKIVGKLYEIDIQQVWQVRELVLYESVLQSKGSVYRAVQRVELRAG